EMFLGQGPDHLKRHLPEITKKAFAKIESGANPSFLTEVEGIGMQARAGGGNLQTMETGPVLLVSDQPPTREKFEVTVERDDLIGDEDEIDLSFQMSRNGKPGALPFLPRLTFIMRMESGVWRLNEASVLARMPLADPDFLKDLVGQIEEKQQRTNEFTATFSIRAIVAAETAYHTKHPGYTCSLSELATVRSEGSGERPRMPIDSDLAKGTKQGYVFSPAPVFLERGAGTRVWDADGNEYTDFMMSFGALIHGHAHPKLVEVVSQAMAEGSHFASATSAEVEAAERFRRMVLSAEAVRFTNTGSEAT